MLSEQNTGLRKFGEGESRTARVFAQLRHDIIVGRLEPGRKLKIEELPKTYDTGTSKVREALSTMCADGLVQRLDQRGFRVDITDEHLDIFNAVIARDADLAVEGLTEHYISTGRFLRDALAGKVSERNP